MSHFNLIIVGARCAGASLALRLAETDLSILLVDRATFPSLPSVPSSPALHPGTLELLDELNISEADYALPNSQLTEYVVNFVGYFQSRMEMASCNAARKYVVGIDRARLDTILWERATAASNVTGQQGLSIQKILSESTDAPVTVIGRTQDGNEQTHTADLIVGADGRFSFTARQVGADIVEQRNEYTSSCLFAEWENVSVADDIDANAFHVYTTDDAFSLFIIPIGNGRVLINTYFPTDHAQKNKQSIQQTYQDGLARVPEFMPCLKHARQVSEVVGMRKIGNGYRQGYGSNWALIGDALHYKDPIDGQGIYDALSASKLLAQAILNWQTGKMTWEEAGAQYEQQFRDFSYPMFEHTVKRIEQQLYQPMPKLLIKTYLRWLMTDPVYIYQFINYLSRTIPAEEFNLSSGLSPKVIGRGILRDIQKHFNRKKTTPKRLITQEMPTV